MPGLPSVFNQFSEVGINISASKPKELCNLSKFRLPIAHTEHLYKANEKKKGTSSSRYFNSICQKMGHNILIRTKNCTVFCHKILSINIQIDVYDTNGVHFRGSFLCSAQYTQW